LANLVATAGVKVTGHICDVASEEDWKRFRDEVVHRHGVTSVNLLFNNA
jgi:short-subunit dehydrogenase involved in D-alanine esterification of teichoic acids